MFVGLGVLVFWVFALCVSWCVCMFWLFWCCRFADLDFVVCCNALFVSSVGVVGFAFVVCGGFVGDWWFICWHTTYVLRFWFSGSLWILVV